MTLTSPRRLGILLALLAVGVLAAAPELRAASEQQQLEALEQERAESAERAAALERQGAALRAEILAIKAEMIALARQTQDHEEQLTEIETTLATLEEERRSRESAFRKQHGNLAGTLSALQRLAVQPPEALIAKPGSPLDTVRSAMLLSIAVPMIEDRALRVRREVEEILALREEIAGERDRLATAAASLDTKRGALAELVQRKRKVEQGVASESRVLSERAEQLAREAGDLRELVEKLAAEAAARAEAERLAAEEARRKAEEEARLAEEAARRAAEAAAMARAEQQEQARREAAARKLAEQQEAKQQEAERQDAERRAAEQKRAAAEAAKQSQTQLALATPGKTPAPGTSQGTTSGTRLSDLPAVKLTKPDNVRSFPANPVQILALPARGRFVSSYGEKVSGEPSAAKGLTIETRAASQVVAPYDGRVAYAGPFRGYGEILIIEHGGRYHTLLAGLDRIDAVVGQWVLAGEPVGVMSAVPESRPRLYLELRRTGQPINPLPWLAASDSKVQG